MYVYTVVLDACIMFIYITCPTTGYYIVLYLLILKSVFIFFCIYVYVYMYISFIGKVFVIYYVGVFITESF